MPRQLRPLLMVLALVGCVEIAVAQVPRRFALDRFENKSCRGKGRLQECDSSTVMRQILAAGSQSVPVLISHLEETRRTKEPIEDFWNYTTSGDIAFILLTEQVVATIDQADIRGSELYNHDPSGAASH